MSRIQDYLNQIKTAIFGEEVRDSIVNSIRQCYDDTSAGKTLADAAAAAANTAATNANSKASAANTAASSANSAASAANTAKNNADTATTAANAAAANANEKASAANTAATNANSKASAANTAAASANTAAGAANTAAANANAKAEAANTAKNNADAATTAANAAATNANEKAAAANTAATNANEKAAAANTAAQAANTAKNNANTATTAANAAAKAIDDMTVSYEDVGEDGLAKAVVSDVDGHKNVHFHLRRGRPGADYTIKGDAFASVEDLQAGVTSPDVGDQYNVGVAPPYHVYRWTGTTWEDQGMIVTDASMLTTIDDMLDYFAKTGELWRPIEDSNGEVISNSSGIQIEGRVLFVRV